MTIKIDESSYRMLKRAFHREGVIMAHLETKNPSLAKELSKIGIRETRRLDKEIGWTSHPISKEKSTETERKESFEMLSYLSKEQIDRQDQKAEFLRRYLGDFPSQQNRHSQHKRQDSPRPSQKQLNLPIS